MLNTKQVIIQILSFDQVLFAFSEKTPALPLLFALLETKTTRKPKYINLNFIYYLYSI